ncbi:hypothetical protein CEQ90_15095 [Lewinellaceae bacterium SD302]|nr:hypothetical protein CEQ90_15095 [Lewinellaceae bacterium SD302]
MEKIDKVKDLRLFDNLYHNLEDQSDVSEETESRRIHGSLKKLAEDARFYEYCRKHTGNSRAINEVYFDAASIVDMLIGLQLVSINEELRDQEFRLSSWRVLAMAFRGWLGKINLLGPHYEEIIDRIQEDRRVFPLKEQFTYAKIRPLLLEATGLSALIKRNSNTGESNIDLNEMDDSAVPAFVVTYFLKGKGYWKNRLKQLNDKRIIEITKQIEYDAAGVIEMPLFEEIREQLDLRRSRLTQSNYVDAIALCILQQKLEKALEEKSPIPVFFSDTKNVDEIIEYLHDHYTNKNEAPPLHVYDGNSKQYMSVVRQSDYFVIHGISHELGKDEDHHTVEDFRKSLSELNAAFNVIPSQATPLELLEEIQQLSIQNFALGFIASWLSEKADVEFKELLTERDKGELQSEVDEYIEKLRDDLKKKSANVINKAKFIREIWRNLKPLGKSIRENSKHIDTDIIEEDVHIDFVRNELETRFGMSTHVCEEIEATLWELYTHARELQDLQEQPKDQKDDQQLNSKRKEFRRAIKRHTVGIVSNILLALFAKIDQKDKKRSLDNLAHGLGILWMLDQFGFIRKVLRSFLSTYPREGENEGQVHRFFSLLNIVAIIKQSDFPDLALAAEKVSELEEQIEKEQVSGKYQLLTGLTYVNFLLWDATLTMENDLQWYFPEAAEAVIPEHFGGQTYEWLITAKRYAADAISLIDERVKTTEKSNTHKLEYYQRKTDYLKNNEIFFIIYTAGKEELMSPRTRSLINSLGNAIRNRRIVQGFRFSDTLSRYHLRRALLFYLNGDKLKLRAQIGQAKDYCKMAKKPDLSLQQDALIARLNSEITELESLINDPIMSQESNREARLEKLYA